jgi:hypothetical protein
VRLWKWSYLAHSIAWRLSQRRERAAPVEPPALRPDVEWIWYDSQAFVEVSTHTLLYFDPLGGDWTFGSKRWHWPSGFLSPLVAMDQAERCIEKGLM